MAEIANYLGYSGSYTAARDLRRRVLDARALVFGHQHPDTLTARHELASWTEKAGDAAAERDQYAMLLAIRERSSAPITRTPWPPNRPRLLGPEGRDAAGLATKATS
jgi:hypothetical protein